jgi:hypothetical protein
MMEYWNNGSFSKTPGPDRDNVFARIKLSDLKALQLLVLYTDMSHQGGPIFQHSLAQTVIMYPQELNVLF